MSEYDSNWDDDDFDSAEDARSKDSPQMRDLRKANRAKEKQIKELMEQLGQVQKSNRERSVKDVLSARGLSSKIALFIPEDVTSPEDVEAWIDEYGDVFGGSPDQAQADTGVRRPAAPSEDLEALGRIASTQSSGQQFSGDADQMLSLIRSASSEGELNSLIFGNANGPQAY